VWATPYGKGTWIGATAATEATPEASSKSIARTASAKPVALGMGSQSEGCEGDGRDMHLEENDELHSKLSKRNEL
jgi:hypothetical protein